MNTVFEFLAKIDDLYWGSIGIALVILSGIYFTIQSRFYQFKVLGNIKGTFKDLIAEGSETARGQNPIKLYFASVSGMAGLGNIVAVITAVLIGGPGALVWLWIAALCGMIIKYAEIYLGIKYRRQNNQGGFDGGPMYYLQEAYQSPFLKKFFFTTICILLCIYGVEVYQFVIIADTLSHAFHIDKVWVVAVLTVLTLYAGLGGIQRLATVCSVIGPAFILLYFGMCLWVIGINFALLPSLFALIFKSALMGHAALGGFAGSTMMLAAQQGTARAVYSGDIGIGYDSIIQSETQAVKPEKQARIAIVGILTDTSFCTLSILVVLTTGLWTDQDNNILTSEYVARSLAMVFGNVHWFMTFFIFAAGWTTIIAFLAVGQKAAYCLSAKYGKSLFFLYAAFALPFFAFFDQSKVIILMSLSGGMLVLCNVMGMFRLRHKIEFK